LEGDADGRVHHLEDQVRVDAEHDDHDEHRRPGDPLVDVDVVDLLVGCYDKGPDPSDATFDYAHKPQKITITFSEDVTTVTSNSLTVTPAEDISMSRTTPNDTTSRVKPG